MSEDLVAFLLARIAEDDELDYHTRQCQTHRSMPTSSPFGLAGTPMVCDCGMPERWLVECEAKRRIIETIVPDVDQLDWQRDQEFGSDPPGDTADRLLKLLALPYQDHPQFLPEWAPTTCGNADR